MLEEGSVLTQTQRNDISTETGIKRNTILHELPTVHLFASFPINVTHLFMNISKDLMELWKVQNVHLNRHNIIDDCNNQTKDP